MLTSSVLFVPSQLWCSPLPVLELLHSRVHQIHSPQGTITPPLPSHSVITPLCKRRNTRLLFTLDSSDISASSDSNSGAVLLTHHVASACVCVWLLTPGARRIHPYSVCWNYQSLLQSLQPSCQRTLKRKTWWRFCLIRKPTTPVSIPHRSRRSHTHKHTPTWKVEVQVCQTADYDIWCWTIFKYFVDQEGPKTLCTTQM